MKKLMVVTALMGTLAAFAADEKTEVSFCATADQPTVKTCELKAGKPQLSPEEKEARKAAMKAKREKMMAERQAKMLETVKKYGLDDEKAAALLKDLESVMRPERPGRKSPEACRPKGCKPEGDCPTCPKAESK